MQIHNTNDPESVFDTHFTLNCPHCQSRANVTALSIPRYEYLMRFRPNKVGIVYRCDACNAPIFLKFDVVSYDTSHNRIRISDAYEEIERPTEKFEFQYLPEQVRDDFREALTCYSTLSYNAFGAMCRRVLQSAFAELGAGGKDRVMSQLKEVKEAASIDDETYAILEQIIIAGHDGVHPHLPKLSRDRSAILLELMKDVLYQLFVRQAKIRESMALRRQAIEDKRQVSPPTQDGEA